MATKSDFDQRFVRLDSAVEAIKAKLANSGLSAAEEDAVLADLETRTAGVEELAK